MATLLNEWLSFGAQGSATKLIKYSSGIDLSEDAQHSWTERPVVEIGFELPIVSQNLRIEILANPYIIPGQIEEQHITFYIGGLFSTFERRRERGTLVVPIPPNMAPVRVARMSLVIPTARSPASLGISDDQRELGLMLETIAFRVEK